MTITLEGRIASKKNSKRVFRNRFTGRTVVTSSTAYGTWHANASLQLLPQRPPSPLTGSLALTLHLYLKGKLDQDLDNAAASVMDLFQDCGVIENDKQIVELHLYKHPGQPDFRAIIDIENAPTIAG
jgi:Holliday junction resolvase RusA-like endonuclease